MRSSKTTCIGDERGSRDRQPPTRDDRVRWPLLPDNGEAPIREVDGSVEPYLGTKDDMDVIHE